MIRLLFFKKKCYNKNNKNMKDFIFYDLLKMGFGILVAIGILLFGTYQHFKQLRENKRRFLKHLEDKQKKYGKTQAQ